MEPRNSKQDRIYGWLAGGSGFGPVDNGVRQGGEADHHRQFHGRGCSPSDRCQSVRSGEQSNPPTGNMYDRTFHHATEIPACSKLAGHTLRKSPPVIRLHYKASAWAKLYSFCRVHRTYLAEKFSEEQIKEAMKRALIKGMVSIDIVNSFSKATDLSASHKKVIDLILAECFCNKDSATPVTSGLQQAADSKRDVTPPTSVISKEAPALIASSHTRETPLPTPKTPPTLQRVTQIEHSDHKSSVLPELQEYSDLHLVLASLGISPGDIKKIIACKPHELETPALFHTLTYELSLGDETALLIVSHVKPSEEVDRMMKIKNGQLATDQQESEFWRIKRLKQLQVEKFNYDNDFQLALELSTRNISEPQFTKLVFGSKIDSAAGSRVDFDTTVFADIDHADLCGTIYETVEQVPAGKKFKEILIMAVPEMLFEGLEASQTLFRKIYNLLEDNGKLSISFATSPSGYNNETFSTSVLQPAGFNRFQFSTQSRGRSCVSMNAYKIGVQQRGLLQDPLRQLVPSGASVAPSLPSQAAQSNDNPHWVEYTPEKKALISMLQRMKDIDHEVIGLALNDPRKPEFNLTADEFAHLKVRYNESQQMREKPSVLPGIQQIHNSVLLLQEARELYQAIVGQGE